MNLQVMRLLMMGMVASVCAPGELALSLPGPARHELFGYNFSQHSKIRWQNGRLVAVDFYHDSIVVHDGHGHLVTQAHITMPGASRVAVNDLTISTTGVTVATVTAFGADGSSASFLLWLDAKGAVGKAVRTTPFAPMRICFAPDGTIWAVGRENDARHEDVPAHDVLRQFDPTGVVIKSLLPVIAFTGYSSFHHPGLLSQLTISNDRIGFYSGGNHEWVELSWKGELLGRWPGMQEDVTGAGMSAGGKVFVSVIPGKVAPRNAAPGNAAPGNAAPGNAAPGNAAPGNAAPGNAAPVIYQLDKSAGSWIPVEVPGSVLSVAGTEGGSLLVLNRGSYVDWLPVD